MPSYLQLAAHQGGTQFGPFNPGPINIGSNRAQCQIAVPPQHGVGGLHCTLNDLGNGNYTISPVSMNQAVFLSKAGRPSTVQITTQMGIQAGDSIVIGSKEGPRFTLQWQAGQPAMAGGAPGAPAPGMGGFGAGLRGGGAASGAGASFGQEMGQAFRYQAESSLMTKFPLYRDAMQFWYKLRTGVYWRPRYIAGALMGVIIFIGIAVVGCAGSLIAAIASIMR